MIPHSSEEVYSLLGGSGFCSTSEFPRSDRKKENSTTEKIEELVKNTFHDIEEIIRFKKLSPKRVFIYTAEAWRYEVYNRAVTSEVKNAQSIALEFLKEDEYKRYGKELIKAVNRYVSAKEGVPSAKEELDGLAGALDFFKGQFNCEFSVCSAENPAYDPIKKAKQANPGKPAIYIET